MFYGGMINAMGGGLGNAGALLGGKTGQDVADLFKRRMQEGSAQDAVRTDDLIIGDRSYSRKKINTISFCTEKHNNTIKDDFVTRVAIDETTLKAIDYWSKMYKVNIGTEELRWPLWVQELFGVKDRVQRWFVLIILPISLALLSYRSLQAMIQIYLGKREMVIAGHEAEELVKDNKNILKD